MIVLVECSHIPAELTHSVKSILNQISHNHPDQANLRFYRGTSMSSTFQAGDCLWMKPISLDEVRKGDVVIFRGGKHQEMKRGNEREDENLTIYEMHTMEETQSVPELVHRVIAIQTEGLVTRGDNNPYADLKLVTEENLVGLVTHVERDGNLHQVGGNRMGLVRAWILRAWKLYIWKMITHVGQKPYRWLYRKNWIARIWHPEMMKIRLLYEDERFYKYIVRGRTVACWWPARNYFECRRPYDLLVRREYLPKDTHI